MFDRFTDRAKKLMYASRQQALAHSHDELAPEHLLLAMLVMPGSDVPRILADLHIDAAAVERELRQHLVPGGRPAERGQLPFTPGAKRVLEHTLAEPVIDIGHLLAGLLAAGDSGAAKTLTRAGLTFAAVRGWLTGQVTTDAPSDTTRCRLLLISNSTMHGGGYLDHCAAEIRDFLDTKKHVMFVPYALANHEEYADRAAKAFAAFGHQLFSVHRVRNPDAALEQAEAVFIGGGNTFRLLNRLYSMGLLHSIAARARAGLPYIGSSAGTNVATLSIRTTNDMPIVQPPSFTAMRLVPFQINPHYLDPDPASKHMGETREERLRQFHEEHTTPVLGLREGCMLRVEGTHMDLRGTTRARLFLHGREAQEYAPPCDLSFLLQHA